MDKAINLRHNHVLAIVDNNTIREIAKIRRELHSNHSSSRRLSKDYEYIGLIGEAKFARVFGLHIDLTKRVGGDKGIDFFTSAGKVDVKTARKASHLLVEEGKVYADIYVLAHYSGEAYSDETIELLGWEYGDTVKQCPAEDLCGHGIVSHHILSSELRDIESLKGLINGN